MAPYVPGEQPRPGQRLIKLNTNENPYPPSPTVRRRIREALKSDTLRLYPPPRPLMLIERAAAVFGVTRDMILAGNGCDELLGILFRAVLGRGDTLAYPSPSYTLYHTLATIQEARVRHVPYSLDGEAMIAALARASAKLTIVCNPNSPSGAFTSIESLGRLAVRLKPRLLAIDEAYVDFAEEHALPLLKRHGNVIILRSFSKSFSLAGVRLGLCFAASPVIETLSKIKDSYNVNGLTLAAGIGALEDIPWMRRNVARVKRERARAQHRLAQLGFEVLPSSANFVFARIPNHDLSSLAGALRRKNILVRHFNSPELRDGLRISIGTQAEMNALYHALENLMHLADQVGNHARSVASSKQPESLSIRQAQDRHSAL
jgi:histidinol-phosphate aminotransferase